jgi:hypothetical protein
MPIKSKCNKQNTLLGGTMLKKLKYIATVSSVLSIAALLATGCGSVSTPNQNASANSTSSPAANSSAPTASSSSAPTASPAAVSKELVVYSATGFDKPVADAFQKKTGITVKLQGAPAAAGLRPDGIKWNTVDPIAGAQHENEVKTWFTQNIVQK